MGAKKNEINYTILYTINFPFYYKKINIQIFHTHRLNVIEIFSLLPI